MWIVTTSFNIWIFVCILLNYEATHFYKQNIALITLLSCKQVSLCHGACAEVDSDTEAVAGKGFKLGCISCKMRPEVEASATVDWYFKAKGEADYAHVSI